MRRPLRDYEKDWTEFWEGIICPDGVLNLDQVKRELSDYRQLMDSASKVYYELTGWRVSKTNTDPEVVISLNEELMQKTVAEAIDDYKEELEMNSDS